MSIEAGLLRIGSSIASVVGKAWLDDRQAATRRQMTLAELVTARAIGIIPQRRLNRQLEQLAETISDRLQQFVEIEYRELETNEKSAALLAVAETLEHSDLSDKRILAADVSADEIYALVVPAARRATQESLLSDAGSAYFELILHEAIAYIAEVITALPSFEGRALRELLGRDSLIIDQLREILDRMPQRTSKQPVHESKEFELAYRREVARKLDRVEIFGVTLSGPSRRYSLTVSYISLSASTSSEDDGERHDTSGAIPRAPIEEILSLTNRLLLRGEAGSGKTTLLTWLAVRSAQQTLVGTLSEWNGLVPFFVRLRMYSDEPLPAIEDLQGQLGWQIGGRPSTWISDILSAGGGLLLIDGVDEVPEYRRRDVHDWLDDLINAYPGCRYIVTSRPPAAREDWLDSLGFTSAELQPMSPEHIRAFIEHWHEAAALDAAPEEVREIENFRQSLVRTVDRNAAIKSLAANPLLCALICALNRDRRTQLPRDRLELFYTALEMFLSRRDSERRINDGTNIVLTLRDKLTLLGELAYWFTVNGLTDADRARVVNQLSSTLESLPSVSIVAQDAYEYLLVRSGLLREPINGRVDFVHKSFQEYLAARQIVDDDSVEMLLQRAHDDSFREVIILAAGYARPREQDLLIAGLIESIAGHARRSAERIKLQLICVQCLETAKRLSPHLHRIVTSMIAEIAPPRSMSHARVLAAVGPDVLSLLPTRSLSEQEAAATVRTAGLVGGDAALSVIAALAKDSRPAVQSELNACWSYFDPHQYADRVLRLQKSLISGRIVVSDPRLLPAVAELPYASAVVRIKGAEEEDLRRAAALPMLEELHLVGDLPTADLTWLQGHQRLSKIRIGRAGSLSLKGIESLPRLTSLEVDIESNPFSGTRHFDPEIEFRYIRAVPRLRQLSIPVEDVHHVSALLGSLPDLRVAKLTRCTGMASLFDLGAHSRLSRLELIECTELATLAGIDEFPALGGLSITRAPWLTDLLPLKCLSSLRALSVTQCAAVRLQEMAGAVPEIRQLTIKDVELPFDLAQLAPMNNLRRLKLNDLDWVIDLSPLSNLRSLDYLDVSRCAGTKGRSKIDLSPLRDIPNLRVLHSGNITNEDHLHQTSSTGTSFGRLTRDNPR